MNSLYILMGKIMKSTLTQEELVTLMGKLSIGLDDDVLCDSDGESETLSDSDSDNEQIQESNAYIVEEAAKNMPNPNVTLGIRMLTSLGMSMYLPGAVAASFFNKALSTLLTPILGTKTPLVQLPVMIGLQMTDYSPYAFGNALIPKLVQEYGSTVYFAAPLAELLLDKAPTLLNAFERTEVFQNAHEFFGAMYGYDEAPQDDALKNSPRNS